MNTSYNFQLPVFILSKLQVECKSDKKSREHRQKTFAMLSELWPLSGWGVLGESIKKGIFVTKIFFQIMLVSADIKIDVKHKK